MGNSEFVPPPGSATSTTQIDESPGVRPAASTPTTHSNAPIADEERLRANGTRMLAGVLVLLIVGLAAGLIGEMPADDATFVASLRTSVATFETFCDQQIWDLPPGTVTRRSPLPGGEGAANVVATRNVTIALLPGSRIRLRSVAPGDLRVEVSRAAGRGPCGNTSGAFFRASADDDQVIQDDEIGLFYRASMPRPSAAALTLPFSGRLIVGEPAQEGGGWSATAGVLLSGQIDLRIVPIRDSNPVTVESESASPGGIFDSHPCLNRPNNELVLKKRCPGNQIRVANGVVRELPDGDLHVQVEAHSNVAMTSLSGQDRTLTVQQIKTLTYSSWSLLLIPLAYFAFNVLTGYGDLRNAIDDLVWYVTKKVRSWGGNGRSVRS